MYSLPYFRQVKSSSGRLEFAQQYEVASGLPIPNDFVLANNNQVFGVYRKNTLIGGFILGHGPAFRTIALFAGPEHRDNLYEQFSTSDNCTEICCFFIAPRYRQQTLFNFFTWAAMIYAQVRYGRKTFLFGTCSRSLAKLYGQTEKSVLLHQDKVNGKATFIFWSQRRHCVSGMLTIMKHKLKRVMQYAKRRRVSII